MRLYVFEMIFGSETLEIGELFSLGLFVQDKERTRVEQGFASFQEFVYISYSSRGHDIKRFVDIFCSRPETANILQSQTIRHSLDSYGFFLDRIYPGKLTFWMEKRKR